MTGHSWGLWDGGEILWGQEEKECHSRGLNQVGAALFLLRGRSAIPRPMGKECPVSHWQWEREASSEAKKMERPSQEATEEKNLLSLSEQWLQSGLASG